MASRLRARILAALLWAVAGMLVPAPAAAGAQTYGTIRSIELHGLERTQPRTVLRELPFAEGDAWRPEFAGEAERRLMNLGLFSEVEVRPPDEGGRVTVWVNERWSLWLLPEATRKDNGASSAGIALEEYNLWGLNHHLRLAWREDTGKNFTAANGASWSAAYDWRRIADSKNSLMLSASRGTRLYDAYLNGVWVGEYRQLSHDVSLLLSHAFGPVPGEGWDGSAGVSVHTRTYRLASGRPQPDVRPSRAHTLHLGLSFRDVHEHVDWFTGRAMDWTLDWTPGLIGSSFNAMRQILSLRDYRPIGSTHHTLNVRFEAGGVVGDVYRDGLFDLGHRNGLRGYFPGEVQASAYLIASLEGRYQIERDSNVQVALFSDAGLLGGQINTIRSRRWLLGMGTGVRWTLRWLVNGTLRLDLAYGFASRRWRAYLGTGQAF